MEILALVPCKKCGKDTNILPIIDTETKSYIYTVRCSCGNYLKNKNGTGNELFLSCPDRTIALWNKQNKLK